MFRPENVCYKHLQTKYPVKFCVSILIRLLTMNAFRSTTGKERTKIKRERERERKKIECSE